MQCITAGPNTLLERAVFIMTAGFSTSALSLQLRGCFLVGLIAAYWKENITQSNKKTKTTKTTKHPSFKKGPWSETMFQWEEREQDYLEKRLVKIEN